jgi:DNA-directed RNA polymerase subunit RPC12/RpoP
MSAPMSWNCAVCGGRVGMLDMMLASGSRDRNGDWLCRCSLCGANMHRDCLARSALGNGIAAEVAKVNDLRRRMVPGVPPGYFLCTRCRGYVMGQFFEERVNFYEKTKRLEELALLYEAYDRLELAGATRERASGRVVRNINVDLNSLLDMLQRRGLSAGYRCPNCAAPLTIGSGTSADGLRFCGYCGSALNTEMIQEAVRRALG